MTSSYASSLDSVSLQPVYAVERDRRCERQPLVAVDEGVVAREGVQQGRSLLMDARVGIGTERARTRATEGRLEQAMVTHHRLRADRSLGDMQ